MCHQEIEGILIAQMFCCAKSKCNIVLREVHVAQSFRKQMKMRERVYYSPPSVIFILYMVVFCAV